MGVERLIKPIGRAIAKRKTPKPREKTVSGTRVDKMPSLFKGKPGEYKAARDAKTKDIIKKRKGLTKGETFVAGTIAGGIGSAALVGAGGGKEDKKQTASAKRKAEYAAYAKKQAAKKKKADAAKKKKTTTAKKKRRLLFGKNAIIRPFKGKIAKVLLGEDEKFGGDKGLIDFLKAGGLVTNMRGGGNVTQGMRNTVKVPPPKGAWATPPKGTGGVKPSTSSSGLSKVQLSMLKQAQLHARNTGQNPKTLQDLVAKYGNQLKGGGRKGKAKGAPRPGGRRNGGEVMTPPLPTARRTRPPAAGAGLSNVQKNMLKGAQQSARSTRQNPQALQDLTAKYGQLLKPREGRPAMLPGVPAPGGMKHGGAVGKKGRASKPRGVGVAKRGYGRAMKK